MLRRCCRADVLHATATYKHLHLDALELAQVTFQSGQRKRITLKERGIRPNLDLRAAGAGPKLSRNRDLYHNFHRHAFLQGGAQMRTTWMTIVAVAALVWSVAAQNTTGSQTSGS